MFLEVGSEEDISAQNCNPARFAGAAELSDSVDHANKYVTAVRDPCGTRKMEECLWKE
jgi:hypothetical protein